MDRIKKIATVLFIGIMIVVPFIAIAQEAPPTPVTDIGGVLRILETVRNWIFAVLGVVVVIMLLVAAFHFITSGGSEDKLKKAKDTLMYAIIGLVVMILAGGIVPLVRALLE